MRSFTLFRLDVGAHKQSGDWGRLRQSVIDSAQIHMGVPGVSSAGTSSFATRMWRDERSVIMMDDETLLPLLTWAHDKLSRVAFSNPDDIKMLQRLTYVIEMMRPEEEKEIA